MKQDISKQQIDAWKAKYGDVFKISVGEGEDKKSCYLRKPNRKELGAASSIGTSDPLKFNEFILNNCWLGGDPEIKTDDTLFLSVAPKLANLIEIKDAELEKL